MKSPLRTLTFVIATAVPLAAQDVVNVDTSETFTSIQDAIDDADTLDGHTLEMLVATHVTPEVQVVFTKDLTLRAGSPGDTLMPSSDTGTAGDARGWFLVPLGRTVAFEDLTFDGTGFKIFTAIRNHGTLTVDSCHFTEIQYNASGPTYNGIAISHFAAGGALMTVSDCTFTEIGRIGLHIFDPALIERCVYTGKGVGNWLDYFADVGSSGASIGMPDFVDCTVSGNRGVALSDGSISAGVLVSTFFGAGTTATFTGCSFTDNTVGVYVGFLTSNTADVTVTDSVIAGNDYGLYNASSVVIVDAVGNWWGHASGPTDPAGTFEADNPPCFPADFSPALDVINADGLGDSVTDGNVDYCSWLTSAGTLALTIDDCQDDVDVSPGQQIAIELHMLDLVGPSTGFQAFVEYDVGTLAYRGDLSSYTSSPFPLHILPIFQADDGKLELDGSDAFGGTGTTDDALLATLVFDVVTDCGPTSPATFEVGGVFPSELSYLGSPLGTLLIDSPSVTLDDEPPVLGPCPGDIVLPADAGACSGAIATWTDPTATDNCDASPDVVCSPPSGSFFPVGTTTVTCTATDDCGNESSCTFDVTITPTNLVAVEVELVGVTATPIMRCIHFVGGECDDVTDVVLTFTDHDLDGGTVTPVRATAVIEIPCGPNPTLCAKDEQHTEWDDTTLTISGTMFVADTILSLEGGDTDNDGDCDINDVTLFIFQFGDLAHAGGCPWDGVTRDADFSNNGAVGSEDYSFLTGNFLTLTACPCTIPLVGGGPDRHGRAEWSIPTARLPAAMAVVDRSGDGIVDWADVRLFENEKGLPNTLSVLMERAQR